MHVAEPSDLPEVIPIFPLTGVLLLPRGKLPLNIFEPRYLAMTRDALGGERLIGMVQPSDPEASERNPAVYPVGCAGRITTFSETDDGRFLITLTGVSRFRIREELPLRSGYRPVVPDWTPFAADREPESEPRLDRERLFRALRAFFAQRQIGGDWKAIESAPDELLVTSIAMVCPLPPNEKQALLEAADFTDRSSLLIALLEMAAAGPTHTAPSSRQ
ncbi:MAG: LON peptidase substrate-binding domain-containing protein [Alphaproteobacteria bacterium]|nr:LON peptidase substrate-binding domain-containing protein [Alphaproteobacteria bacterium]